MCLTTNIPGTFKYAINPYKMEIRQAEEADTDITDSHATLQLDSDNSVACYLLNLFFTHVQLSYCQFATISSISLDKSFYS
jgi:hypothetical protein